VSEIKYLGVIIDKNLNFAGHVDYIGKKIGAKLGVLRRVSKDMTTNRCMVYKSVVAPLFEYCASLLIDIDKTNLQYLQKLQNNAMRIILRYNRRVRIADMLEFMSIKKRIDCNVCLIYYIK